MDYNTFKLAFLELEKEFNRVPTLRMLRDRLKGGSFSTLSKFFNMVLAEREKELKERAEEELLTSVHKSELENKIQEIFIVAQDFVKKDSQLKIDSLSNVINDQQKQISVLAQNMKDIAKESDLKEIEYQKKILNDQKEIDDLKQALAKAREENKALLENYNKTINTHHEEKDELKEEIKSLKSQLEDLKNASKQQVAKKRATKKPTEKEVLN